ncbi:hypothetical protein CRG49_004025 [Neisseria sp. N95_16]|uniref:Uncharacterized protein n=1 Tax=Neisseria brasiliensis TaxID=2666100 RepID=A0A5Q3RVR4_9NEIS|nr:MULTISPECIES: phage virion morphogenesis protein [Neisseria]MRN37200.1 hypothetical protein [Neisseria brasiliensis]PJO10081.1 hypothetical protein CRG49_004025 [Neisseria sp. N95_16]PJO78744.1 hypothetical protein CWC45_03160 [Neisseria sp. N177_16]QGL24209.1 hypothetical protein GJV52_00765 [Neisseria brasiliensis]
MAYRDADSEKYSADPLNKYLDDLESLIKNLSAPERKKLTAKIAREMQKRNRQRIADNVDPQHIAYAPRAHAWDLRRLRDGEKLWIRQKFNFFKDQDLELAFTRQAVSRNGNPVIQGRHPDEPREATGYVNEWIYLKKRNGNKKLRMFKKLKGGKYLRFKSDSQSASIGFFSGLAANIAYEHHYGNSRKNLPARELVGFNTDDLSYIHNEVLAAVSKGI